MSKNITRPTKAQTLRRAATFLLLFVPLYYIVSRIYEGRKAEAAEGAPQTRHEAEANWGAAEPSAAEAIVTGGDIAQPHAEGETLRLELPRRTQGESNLFVTHYAGGRVNYSLEYDTEPRHARWVAFTFDRDNSPSRVRRSDAWRWDPKIPARYSTESWFRGSGYSRGHLVASEDRAYSHEANAQTFFYSNISPQLYEHNSGIWVRIEQKIREWGRDNGLRDVLYVAKGGTIRDDQVEKKRIKGQMVVPRYYWAALLLERDGAYHSIAFLTEHRAYQRGEERLRDLALSVDALEEFTGLDFFHALPDDVEARVEAEDPNARTARTIWWN